VARVLIVGCGCRGRELAAALVADGVAVRGTTRDQANFAAIEATGAEATLADPDRLSTLLPSLEDVAVVCWLIATGDPRLASLLEKLVDTPVRGFVYEVTGTVPPAVREAARRRIPIELLEHDPADHDSWLAAALAAVRRLLSPS
jgi:nucleoside-diphosphate-sugar epimerase